eukprot:TRINITY_DN4733_c0_g2_i13.p1 TRINITY_DN4733_c0_g2~~TRINITY_DN4733_c0_g2_i13.p1  ORF type:complete len:204 (+),score=24.23 TRINITY_DN4733_c0_g2_i13:83-694(+)
MNTRPTYGPFNCVPYRISSCQIISDSPSLSTPNKCPTTTPMNYLKISGDTESSPRDERYSGGGIDYAESWEQSLRADTSCYKSPRSASKGPIEFRVEKFTGIDKSIFQFNNGAFSSPRIVRANFAQNDYQKRLTQFAKTNGLKAKNGNVVRRRVSANILLDKLEATPIRCTAELRREYKSKLLGVFPALPLTRILATPMKLPG